MGPVSHEPAAQPTLVAPSPAPKATPVIRQLQRGKPLRRFNHYVRLSKSPERRKRLAATADVVAKRASAAIAASLIGDAIVRQRLLTSEDVDLELREYLLSAALQLCIISLLL